MISFSVVIPTRNRPAFLRQAVASVLAQTHAPREILVVDDGEGEAAPALASLGASSIRVLDNRRRGPVAARILGVDSASADAIAFLDDDDAFTDPTYLAAVAQGLAEGAAFCFCDGEIVFASGRPALPFSYDADAQSLETDNTILISGVCYRRDLHAALGGFDEALPYYWDWDWYLRVARSGARLHHHARPAVSIRVHDQNMSSDAFADQRQANLDALARKHGLRSLVLKNHLSLAEETVRPA